MAMLPMSMAQHRRISRIENGVEIPGTWLNAFIHNGNYYLTEIRIYKDGKIDCWELVDLEGFKKKVEVGWVVTSLPEGAHTSISFLADFNAKDVKAFIREDEFLKEVIDEIAALNGQPTSSDICCQAYKEFQETKTEEARAKLKAAYEAVPEHNRRYVLHDMDVKDIPIRMIIYGEDEIEKWSHRIASKHLGLKPLPTIKVEGALKRKPPWWKFW
jgi:hypothetical protein